MKISYLFFWVCAFGYWCFRLTGTDLPLSPTNKSLFDTLIIFCMFFMLFLYAKMMYSFQDKKDLVEFLSENLVRALVDQYILRYKLY